MRVASFLITVDHLMLSSGLIINILMGLELLAILKSISYAESCGYRKFGVFFASFVKLWKGHFWETGGCLAPL